MVVKCDLLEDDLNIGFFEMPCKKQYFTHKTRGPIEKRVANSDSSENFGLGGMFPKFFYHYHKGFFIAINFSLILKNDKNLVFIFFQ